MPPTQLSWKWISGGTSTPGSPFNDHYSGWRINFDAETSELDFLQMTLTEEVIELAVYHLNKYAEQVISANPSLSKRQAKWTQVQPVEFIRFLAIRIIMGIDKKPEMSHFWSRDPILQSSFVPKIMNSDRFFEIQRYLHFSDNELQIQGDRLFKIREIWDKTMENFGSILDPFQDLSVDESLVKFKGRLSWKQFIPSKRSRFGIKTFSLVDSKTGFVLNSKIYSGKGRDDLKFDVRSFGYGGAILLELVEPYFKKYHTIYADNYFTSPALAIKLLEEETYLCGTVKSNRKNLPKIPKKMGKDSTI